MLALISKGLCVLQARIREVRLKANEDAFTRFSDGALAFP
jgi:hypothetical protein